jgi:MarR family 2-MHQ and catechol resistance regulon transcriptional repressor
MVTGPEGVSTVAWQVARSAEEQHPDFDPTVLALTLTLYRTMVTFDRAHTTELTPHGLTLPQFNVLTVLHRSGRPLTMGMLGQAISVRPTKLTGVVDALVGCGLVERMLNSGDRRSFLIGNTDAGEELLSRLLPDHWRHLASLMSGLTREQRAQLASLLEQLRESIEAGEAGRAGNNRDGELAG